MVTTTCFELTGQGTCKEPLRGKTAEELQQKVFKHAETHHPEKMKSMSPQEHAKLCKRIHKIFDQKSQSGGIGSTPKKMAMAENYSEVEDNLSRWP